jgi:catechol 2,3-dioxygenase-like lactoylglutathione lyase family enzyme
MDLIAFVPTTDAARAKAFYADTLGLELQSENEFALVFRVNGTMLRVTLVDEFTPQPFTVLGWDVPDIAAAMRELGERGVAFERFDGMDQDAQGVWRAPGGAYVAWFKDPDGNTLSVAQFTGGTTGP